MSTPEPGEGARAPTSGRSSPAAYAPWSRALLADTGLPRALRRHDTPEGIAYRRYLDGLLDRFGVSRPLPKALVNPLREAGIATLELRRLQADLEGLRERRGGGVRRQEERRLRGEIRKTRVQVPRSSDA